VIREGDAETGVTIMFMDEGLDTGDILLMDAMPILPSDTGGVLHDKLALAAPASLERALDLIAAGNPPRQPQDNALATHCGKLKREDGRLDWSRDAVELERLIRAYNPWPGTSCLLPNEKPLKIHRATLIEGAGACPLPGTLVAADSKAGLLVSCGQGLLMLEEVQAEGGKRISAADFLRGHPIEVGARLG
jgi:methionyl-tRNA formyltransferase